MKCALVAVAVVSVLLVYVLATEDSRLANRVIGATAICNDGAITTSPRGFGVCSGHGGVEKWLD